MLSRGGVREARGVQTHRDTQLGQEAREESSMHFQVEMSWRWGVKEGAQRRGRKAKDS